MHLIEHIQQFVEELSPAHISVAVSGGLDSVVLLDVLVRVRNASSVALPWHLSIVHVNHSLSPNAHVWQSKVEMLAHTYGLPCEVYHVDVDSADGGLESAARTARYNAITEHLSEQSLVLTGHHQNDQAETLLLRLCRGAGVEGLAAMRPLRRLGAGMLGRPLLPFARNQLLSYAQDHALYWVDDESNDDVRFDRNFVRAEVLPLLETRWPAAVRQLAQAAELCGETSDLVGLHVAKLMENIARCKESLGESISLEAFKALGAIERRLVLRAWLNELGTLMPPLQQFVHLDALLNAAQDRMPEWVVDAQVLRRFQARLYCLPIVGDVHPFVDAALPANGVPQVFESNGFRLVAEPSDQGGLALGRDYLVTQRSSVGQMRSKPVGRMHSQTLKKLYLEYGVPPWLREHVPIFLHDGEVAAVGDYWVDQKFWIAAGSPAWSLKWRYISCLLYTSPSPRDLSTSRMPSSA